VHEHAFKDSHNTNLSSSASSICSPTQNTPSKLSCFLKYAETYLGVENACSHEEGLQMLGFGPDILHLVENGVLKDIGSMPGDVIHLKQNSQQWWNSTDAKKSINRSLTHLCQFHQLHQARESHSKSDTTMVEAVRFMGLK
jgi:hypothetical protein